MGQAGTAKRDLWIGLSDIGTELKFTYLSDLTQPPFICDGSSGGTAGRTKNPTTEGSCLMRLLVLEKIRIGQNSH